MSTTPPPIRVMIVDDSAVIRTVISRTLDAQPDIEITGVAVNGDIAVKNIRRFDPDIVILDIEMSVMDGIIALPLLLKEKPGVRVVICSTLSACGADISVRCLALGAAECLLKPGSDSIISAQEFQEELIRIVRSLARKKSSQLTSSPPKFNLRKNIAALPAKIVAIGSSTGGPKILMDIMTDLKNLPVPILITQHMPKTFTTMLAAHISEKCGVSCVEGTEGMAIRPGHAYLAPGGYHMVMKKNGADVVVHLSKEPPENYCRPSVNPMLRSLVPIYGTRIITAILTGMGNDGSQACVDIVNGGGQVIAQDEATSVVWGMPGAVAMAGLCSAVLPTDKIAGAIKSALVGAAL